MGRRKVLSRAESQALTREEILDAAEQTFLAVGYRGASLNAIAAEAGRTIGAIYSNYDSKEELCLEVLERRSSVILAGLMAALVGADDDEARLTVLAAKWADLSSDSGLLILAAEYGITTFRQPEQRARTTAYIDRARESVSVLIEDHVPANLQPVAQNTLKESVDAILATGLGLAQLQTFGVISVEESSRTLVETFRLWLGRLEERVATP
ncbi:TetR/AcrR family transcriptional regulator [Gordonia sp. CPCC 205333]|uniref:TetR/AcrR family transcriptional regulator n=1 Tax=Gordonia sp. CPCC 205333 TaxID=3140790 RepID=UPI003AF3DA69